MVCCDFESEPSQRPRVASTCFIRAFSIATLFTWLGWSMWHSYTWKKTLITILSDSPDAAVSLSLLSRNLLFVLYWHRLEKRGVPLHLGCFLCFCDHLWLFLVKFNAGCGILKPIALLRWLVSLDKYLIAFKRPWSLSRASSTTCLWRLFGTTTPVPWRIRLPDEFSGSTSSIYCSRRKSAVSTDCHLLAKCPLPFLNYLAYGL